MSQSQHLDEMFLGLRAYHGARKVMFWSKRWKAEKSVARKGTLGVMIGRCEQPPSTLQLVAPAFCFAYWPPDLVQLALCPRDLLYLLLLRPELALML